MVQDDFQTYNLGDWHLQNGGTLPDAHIAYKTFGDPKASAIVYPTWFSGGKFGVIGSLRIFLIRMSSYRRQRLVDRRRQDAQPQKGTSSTHGRDSSRANTLNVLHHHPRPLRQRPINVPVEYVLLSSFPFRLLLRQCPGSA